MPSPVAAVPETMLAGKGSLRGADARTLPAALPSGGCTPRDERFRREQLPALVVNKVDLAIPNPFAELDGHN